MWPHCISSSVFFFDFPPSLFVVSFSFIIPLPYLITDITQMFCRWFHQGIPRFSASFSSNPLFSKSELIQYINCCSFRWSVIAFYLCSFWSFYSRFYECWWRFPLLQWLEDLKEIFRSCSDMKITVRVQNIIL